MSHDFFLIENQYGVRQYRYTESFS